MSDYTPTTDEVRNWATFVPNGSIGMHVSERDAAAFDRWLETHEREIRRDQIERDAGIAEDAPGSDATGYYASESHSGYNEAQGHIERAIRAQQVHPGAQ